MKRYKAWLDWCRYSSMNWFQKLLVLLKLKTCTWFEEGWVKKGGKKKRGRIKRKDRRLRSVVRSMQVQRYTRHRRALQRVSKHPGTDGKP